MDVAQAYSNEMLEMLLEKNDQIFDLLQYLIKNANNITQIAEKIDSKMDVALERLNGLEVDLGDLKNEKREIEQKFILMTSKLSKWDSSIGQDALEDYYALAQSMYSNWEDLDALTRKFIPLAEYLYSKLQKYDKPDYSPVILELCRAIENEFLLKIFRKYTLDVVQRKGNCLDEFLAKDKANYRLKNKTDLFAKAIIVLPSANVKFLCPCLT